MSEIPISWLLADALLLGVAVFTATAWASYLVRRTGWRHNENVTIKNALIIGVGMFIPLGITYLVVTLLGWAA